MSHINGSVDHVERPLMTPDEVMRLRPPQKSGNGASEQIVAPGDMLIFVSGHFPILGMQMLYFFDPELQRRAAIVPPIALQTLDGDAVVSQKPIDPTNNVISKPEVVVTEEATSHLEKGFLEELQAGNVRPQKG
jgi:type IV secretion system protein VirD4